MPYLRCSGSAGTLPHTWLRSSFVSAADCYQHALALYGDLGDRYYEADTLTHLGDTHHAAGRPDQARTAWTTALDILTDLDHPDTDTVRAKLVTLDQTPPTQPGASPPDPGGPHPTGTSS